MTQTKRYLTPFFLALFLSIGITVAGEPLTPWSAGYLDIHHISTGKGNATFFVFPDGTTLLIDAGAATLPIPYAEARPNDSLRPGEWIARYIEHFHPQENAILDYALLTHFHGDHMGFADESAPQSRSGAYRLAGITDVAEQVPIRTLIDRGWADYNYPVPLGDDNMKNYRSFLDFQTHQKGMKVEQLSPGSKDQIVLRIDRERYPAFEVRNLAANGVVWTGVGTETRNHFPPLESLPSKDRPSENMCSIALRVSYGKLDYYTGLSRPTRRLYPAVPGAYQGSHRTTRRAGPE